MIKVQSVNLYDILPQILKKDETITAICKILQKYIDENFKLIKNIVLLPNIDNLEEDILDHLAYQFHVDFYDSDLNIDKKRELVKSSIAHHRKKGTKWAVEDLLSKAFDNSWVKEWFEYSGNPYFFRIHTKDIMESESKYINLLKAINTIKNTRSWLEKIILEREKEMNLNICVIKRTLKKLTFKPHQLQDISISQTLYAGTATRQSKKVILNPAILSDNITLTRNIYPSTVRTQSKQVVMKPILPDNKKEIKENINIIGINKRVYKMSIK